LTRPIGILCPMAAERAAILRQMTNVEALPGIKAFVGSPGQLNAGQLNAGQLNAGRLNGRAVILSECGIGKVAAAIAATQLVAVHECRALLTSGVAGGLDPALRIGDIVVGNRLIQHDYGHFSDTAFHHFRPGALPFGERKEDIAFTLTEEMESHIADALSSVGLSLHYMEEAIGAGILQETPRIIMGTILSGDQFVNNEALRAQLYGTFMAQAVEMEGAAVAQVAALSGIPAIAVRALSDLAGAESHLDFPRFLQAVAPLAARVVAALVAVV